jgi:hypothetical protein
VLVLRGEGSEGVLAGHPVVDKGLRPCSHLFRLT